MSDTAILRNLNDRTGATRLLGILEIDLSKGVIVTGGDARTLFLQDDGLWILSEMQTGRPAKTHNLEFIPLERVDGLNFEMTDAARHSDEAIDRLRGLNMSLSYHDHHSGEIKSLAIEDDLLLECVMHDEDASRLWNLAVELLRACASAKVRVHVSATAP